MLAQILLLAALAADSVLHLAACIKENVKLIRATKPFLVPIIVAFYLVSAALPNPLVVVGLLFGLGGDVFLIFRKTSQKALLIGLLSFMIGHVVYIIAYLAAPGYFAMDWWAVLLLVPYPLAALVLYRALKDDLGTMKVPAMVYMCVILVMGAFSMLRVFSVTPASFWLVVAGSTSFIVSDAILAYEQFKKITLLNHAVVMATYIAAQFCIMLGFLFVA